MRLEARQQALAERTRYIAECEAAEWERVVQLVTEQASLEECVVCMDAVRAVRTRPCGHAVMCEACAADVLAAMGTCPFCRSPFETYTLL